MNEEVFNMQIRKFLKKVGVQSQHEIEKSVKNNIQKGLLIGTERLEASVLLEVPLAGLKVTIEGGIELE